MMKFVIGLLSVISLIGCEGGERERVNNKSDLIRRYDPKHNVVCYSSSQISNAFSCIKLERIK